MYKKARSVICHSAHRRGERWEEAGESGRGHTAGTRRELVTHISHHLNLSPGEVVVV